MTLVLRFVRIALLASLLALSFGWVHLAASTSPGHPSLRVSAGTEPAYVRASLAPTERLVAMLRAIPALPANYFGAHMAGFELDRK